SLRPGQLRPPVLRLLRRARTRSRCGRLPASQEGAPMSRHLVCLLGGWLALAGLASPAGGQEAGPGPFGGLRWRMIGPFRGGRTVGATGVPGQPNVFYVGVNNGGVWKTTDAGRTWTPLFDDQPTGSIGALAVAPSNPDVLYVGSGEGL